MASGRRVMTPTMDLGHCSFAQFISERFQRFTSELQADLTTECERIVVTRELQYKKEVERLKNETKRLRQENKDLKEAVSKVKADSYRLSSPDEAIGIDKERETINADSNNPDCPRSCMETVGSIDIAFATLSEENASTSPEDKVDPGGDERSSHIEHLVLWTEWVPDEENGLKLKTMRSVESQLQEDTLNTNVEQTWLDRVVSVRNPEKETESMICIFAPSGHAQMCWDMLGVPVLFYDLVTIPMQVFYESKTSVVGWLVIGYWTADMFLRGFTFGYDTDQGEAELRRCRIMRNYGRRSFLFDFVMVAPDWFCIGVGAPRNVAMLRVFRIMRLARLMRMSKLRAIVRRLQDMIDSVYFSVVCGISSNLFAIIFICHYLGCIWYWLGKNDIDGYGSWVDDYEDEEWPFMYVLCLHWAITQFTPGSSKIQPVNIPEVLVGITVLIFGMVFFSLFVSSLTHERMRLKELTSKMDNDNFVLRRYLRQNHVSIGLTVRAIKYVDGVVAPMLSRVQRKDVALLEYLSKPLQLEIQTEMFCNTLLLHPFFTCLKSMSTTLTSKLIAEVVIEVSLAHDDLLFEVGQVSHEMFFMLHGTLAYLIHGTAQVDSVGKGDWCCEAVLWVPWVHKGSAKARSEVQLIAVDSARIRKEVLEHKEQAYIKQCAQAYLVDINRCIDEGSAVTDLTNVVKLEESQYLRTITQIEDLHLKPAIEVEEEEKHQSWEELANLGSE